MAMSQAARRLRSAMRGKEDEYEDDESPASESEPKGAAGDYAALFREICECIAQQDYEGGATALEEFVHACGGSMVAIEIPR